MKNLNISQPVKTLLLSAVCCAACIMAGAGNIAVGANRHIYGYHNGAIVFRLEMNNADSVTIDKATSTVNFYNSTTKERTYSSSYSSIDSISFFAPQAKADLLDIVFDANGGCSDISPAAIPIKAAGSGEIGETAYNEAYEMTEGCFSSKVWGGEPASKCFKADYSGNSAFQGAIADGHSMECLFKLDYSGNIPDKEAKFFSGMADGGSGFLICTRNAGKNGGNEMAFYVNVSTSDAPQYVKVASGVVPMPEKYYHVVGVWDKDNGKACIYVNGTLMNSVPTQGDMHLPTNSAAQWYGIGCDADNKTGAQACNSHVAIARIYSKALSQNEVDGLWQAVADKAQAPVADLLDVSFTPDGKAEDISPMKNTVEVVSPTGTVSTYYNSCFGTYAAKIANKWGGNTGSTTTYCKVDFENNSKFRSALADGHTIECVWKATYDGDIADAEAKMFSAMQSGGTGFLICKKAKGKNGGNEITFLPNVTTTGNSNWVWATSGIVPRAEHYYHVVGVWNKEEGKAYIYVNGTLCNTVDAAGELRFASSGANWWGIGCDANPGGGEQGGNWEIVNARVYDQPLTRHDVACLWNNIASATKLADDSVAVNYTTDTATTDVPKADLMDIMFGANAQVSDLAVPAHTPKWITNDSTECGPVAYYNTDFKRYVAHFFSEYGQSSTQYVMGYDYEADQAFKDSLSDGHTIEAVVMQDYTNDEIDREGKPFSSHQGGGIGLMTEKTGMLAYLPHIGGGYKHVTSMQAPKMKRFYHVTGVWNKHLGRASIYIDGELRNTIDAEGELQLPKSGCMRMLIGADPTGSGTLGNMAWQGEVAVARLYSKPLTANEVKALYNQIKDTVAAAPHFITSFSYYNNLAVKHGSAYDIFGTGFQATDSIGIACGETGLPSLRTVPITLTSEGARIIIPSWISKDSVYCLYASRGGQLQTLGLCRFNVVSTIPVACKVTAHRGYWKAEGATQNSVAGLKAAINAGLDAVETDVWLTTDGHVMINHDPSYKGVTIKNSTYDQCKDLTLANGEKMPQLQDFLKIIADEDWKEHKTELIIEIKNHGDSVSNFKVAQAVVDAVKAAGVSDRVKYISFAVTACRGVVHADSTAIASCISSSLTPEQLLKLGIRGVNLNMHVLIEHPEWVEFARDNGMTIMAGGIKSVDDIITCNNLSFEYISTDNPPEFLKIRKYYRSLSDKLTVANTYAWVGYPASDFYPKLNGENIAPSELTYNYNKSKLSIDPAAGTIEALATGTHYVTVAHMGAKTTFSVIATNKPSLTGTKYDTSNYDAYAAELVKKWQDEATDSTTMFIGDSFFDSRYFWTNFYQSYWGKDALCCGISSTTSYDWEKYLNQLPSDIKPLNIVMNIGTNNVYDDNDNATTATVSLQRMFTLMHSKLPETKIYYFSIAQRNYNETNQGIVRNVNSKMKEWCGDRSWITYIDITSQLTTDMLRDGIHPKLENYSLYIDSLAATDIVIANKEMPDTIASFSRTVSQAIGDNASALLYKGSTLSDNYVVEGKIDITELGNNAHFEFNFKNSSSNNRMLLWDSGSNGTIKMGYAYNGSYNNGSGDNVKQYTFTTGQTLTVPFKLVTVNNNAYLYLDDALALVFVNATGTGSAESLKLSSEHMGCRVYDLKAKTKTDDATDYDAAVNAIQSDIDTYSGKADGAYRPEETSNVPDTIASFSRTVSQAIGDNASALTYKGSTLSDNYVLEGKIDITELGNNAHFEFNFKNSGYNNRMLLWDSGSNGTIKMGYAYNGSYNNGSGDNVKQYTFTSGQTLTVPFKLVTVNNNAYLYLDGALALVFVNATGTGTAESIKLSSEHMGCRVYDLKAKTKEKDNADYTTAVSAVESDINTYSSKTAGAYRP